MNTIGHDKGHVTGLTPVLERCSVDPVPKKANSPPLPNRGRIFCDSVFAWHFLDLEFALISENKNQPETNPSREEVISGKGNPPRETYEHALWVRPAWRTL